MNKRHINFYCNLSLLFFCNINGHNCSLYYHYCKSCQRMTQLVLLNAKWAIVAISWRAKVTFNEMMMMPRCTSTAGNRHKQNSCFCKEIREDNFRFWWRRVHDDASQGMYMSKIEIFFFTARILQNQRMLCCGECFHD